MSKQFDDQSDIQRPAGEETSRHREDLELLQRASLQLSSTLELKQILEDILENAVKLIQADDIHIFFYDGDQLTFGAALWEGQRQYQAYREPRQDGTTYTVARTGDPLIISDVNNHPLFSGWKGDGAIALLPLRIREQVYGVMNIAFQKPHSFTDQEIHILRLFADQAAVSIQNARLYETVRQQSAEMEQRVAERTAELRDAEERERTTTMGLRTVLAVANELMSCPDLDITLRQAVEAGRSQLGLERCGIFVEAEGFMRGSYGTNAAGQTIDEHGLRIPIGTDWLQRVAHLRPHEAQWVILDDMVRTEWDGKSRVEVGKGWVVVTLIPFPDGRRGFLFNDANLTNTPINEAQQEIVAVFCSLLGKIIERKQAEDSIRRTLNKETELSEIKSRFISTISHEFRTPMAIIQSSTQLLKYYSERMDGEKKLDHLEKIENQIRQMTMLLENVLTISRSESTGLICNPRPLDAVAVCQSLIDEIRLSGGTAHEIIFSHNNDCADCLLDEKLLRQIVTNLLSNALKYSPSKSRIAINVECESQWVVIRVQDEGIGIPAEDQKHLFEDFYRGKNVGNVPGTGLGLSIVWRAAEAHGGAVKVESAEGVGTTFTVTLLTPKLAT